MGALGGSKVSAATLYHWTGVGGTDFADGSNWDLDSAPTNDLTSDIGVFGPGSVTANQPTLLLDRSINGLQFTTTTGGWTLGGAFTLSLGSGGINTNGQTSGTNTISANLQFAAASSLLVGTGGTLLVSGQLSSTGAFGLTLNNGSNAGTLKLNGANTYTGGTTVSAGTLLINNTSGSGTGTGSVTANNAGTVLGGSGIINAAANNVTLNGGTTLAPGATASTIGALTMTAANVIFTGTSGNLATLAIDISGATADKLAITGSLNLSTSFDRLTVTELAAATLPRYQIVTYSGTRTGIFDTTALPSGYSIDYSIPNEIDLVAPVPEPATWFAAALVAVALAWRLRHRFTRIFARRIRFRANWLSLVIVGSFFIGVVSASANLAQVLPEMGDLARWALFSMGNNGLQLSGFTVVQGDVGAAGNGIVSIGGHATIHGNLYYRSNSSLWMDDDATITGARYHNRDSELDNGLHEASRASDHAFALEPTRSYTNINLSRAQSITVQGAPGETVVLQLKNFLMSGSATFTLQGTATTNFIINVTRQFSLSGNSKIVLSGGVQWDNVLFNVRGKGADVLLSGNARLQGILMANLRTVRLSGQSRVIGEVIANRIVMSAGSQIIHPPIVSH